MSIQLRNFHTCMLTRNDCYVRNSKESKLPTSQQDSRYCRYYAGATHIVVHSTGANNPWLLRYVQPDDGILGKNRYGNSWNNPGLDVCVNAFIGRADDGTVSTYQTLPWEFRPWGVGSGSKGSYNDCAIQFEICEDDLTDRAYAQECFEAAALLSAYLCREYGIPVGNIVSHNEAHELGYGSNHGDPEHWWPKFNLSMDKFRARVQEILTEDEKSGDDANKSVFDLSGTGNTHSAWFDREIAWAVENGLFKGDGEGNFGWQKAMTREQFAAVLYRFENCLATRAGDTAKKT